MRRAAVTQVSLSGGRAAGERAPMGWRLRRAENAPPDRRAAEQGSERAGEDAELRLCGGRIDAGPAVRNQSGRSGGVAEARERSQHPTRVASPWANCLGTITRVRYR